MTPIGRDAEVAAGAAALDNLATGPSSIVLTGPAGIGKSTVWQAILAEAHRRGYRTMVARAVEAEAQLAFGGLVDLFERVTDDEFDALPPVQRAALQLALQRVPSDRTAPPPLAASLGALAVLRAMAEVSPVLIAVDDRQWLDPPSRRILEYAARRLDGCRVGFLSAIRTAALDASTAAALGALAGPMLHLHLGPLDMDAVDGLIRRELGISLRRPALAWVHAESRGNPFQGLEIARTLQRSGAAPSLDGLAASVATDDLLRARLASLPLEARWPLAAAAALGRPSMALLTTADPASVVGLEAAHTAGVVEFDAGRIRFSHPLLAAAAYGALEDAERRDLHGRLAAALIDPEERARHRALSIDDTSDAIAAELEDAAGLAERRGASDAAAELMLQAARRTPAADPDGRHRRTLSAAELLIRAGDPARARAVLERHVAVTPRSPGRAEALRVLADARSSDDWEARGRLLEQALDDAGGDHGFRSRILQDIAWTTWHRSGHPDHELALVREAVAEAEAAGDAVSRCSAYLTAVFVQDHLGIRVDGDLLGQALALAPQVGHLRALFSPAYCAACMDVNQGRFAAAVRALTELHDSAVAAGDWDSAPYIAADLAAATFRLGDWQGARRIAIEAEQGSRQNGQATGLARALNVRADIGIHAGDVVAGARLAEEAMSLARDAGSWLLERSCRGTAAFLWLSTGDASRAEAEFRLAAEPLLEAGRPGSPKLLSLWCETLVLLDRAEDVPRLLRLADDVAQRTGRPSGRAAVARVAGLLATRRGDEAAAAAAFTAAIAHHDAAPEPFEMGRTLLMQGESLRRFRRRGLARASLVAALDLFTGLGAPLWQARAAGELARTGHREAGSPLTPTEAEIATLVAAGRTNREIGEVLFMSPHTVEAHLTRIYRSLGIRGRTALARLIGATTDEG